MKNLIEDVKIKILSVYYRFLCVASNAVLKKWLVDNGVECRARERKEVLIRLVTQHIQNTGKTFNL